MTKLIATNTSKLCIWVLLSLISSPILAQRPLAQIEDTLQHLAADILYHQSFEHKLAQHRRFNSLLQETLRRPDSYTYPFDSLKTISILPSEDDAFRVFTWQVVDVKNPGTQWGEQVHYYFGVIQRKYQGANGKTHYVVIPLKEMAEIPPGVENMVLDNDQWLGCLYYPPKYQGERIVQETFSYYTPKGQEGKSYQDAFQEIRANYEQLSVRDQRRLAHMNRKQLERYDSQQKKKKVKLKKVKRDMYVMLGWNGLDHRSNIKVVDVLSFDPQDSSRAIFGANIFYFDPLVAKHRAVFKYSEYSPFSLNYSYVKGKGLFKGKQKMIVYDHLANPKPGERKLKEIWEMGPDGSYDALSYQKGTFRWLRNVETVDELTAQEIRDASENRERIIRARLADMKAYAKELGSEDMVADIERVERKGNLDKRVVRFLRRQEKLLLKRQQELQEQEKQRLKDAGINLTGGD